MPARRKLTLDFVVKSSPAILYNFITTPEGLSQWFAEAVRLKNNCFSFLWEGNVEKAFILGMEENAFIRLRFEGTPESEYLEMRINQAEVTGDTILVVTDFADDCELEDQKRLWVSQVDILRSSVGGSN